MDIEKSAFVSNGCAAVERAPTQEEVMDHMLAPIRKHMQGLMEENRRLQATVDYHKREHDAAVQAAARLEAENKALHAEIERLRGKSFEHAEIADMAEVRKILLAHVQANLPAPFFGPWSTISTRGLLEAALNRTMDRAGQVLAEKVQAGLECYMKTKAMAPIAPRR